MLRRAAAAEEAFHFPADVRKRSLKHFAAGIDDDGPLWTQPFQVEAHRFADAPANAIADHGLADRAGHGEADARPVRCLAAQAESREKRIRVANSLVVDPPEILRSQQADTFRKCVRAGHGPWLPLGTDGEFLPPTGAAAGKHCAAILGFHPAEKPVRFRAVPVIRLKGTFRHFDSIYHYSGSGRCRQTRSRGLKRRLKGGCIREWLPHNYTILFQWFVDTNGFARQRPFGFAFAHYSAFVVPFTGQAKACSTYSARRASEGSMADARREGR
jgi:hypothetical protein